MACDVRSIIDHQIYPIAESEGHILRENISCARGQLNELKCQLLYLMSIS